MHDPSDALILEAQHRRLHRPFVVGDDGEAVRRLVTRGDQGVDGERVLLRRRQLLLDQGPDHPQLFVSELHGAGTYSYWRFSTTSTWAVRQAGRRAAATTTTVATSPHNGIAGRARRTGSLKPTMMGTTWLRAKYIPVPEPATSTVPTTPIATPSDTTIRPSSPGVIPTAASNASSRRRWTATRSSVDSTATKATSSNPRCRAQNDAN